MSKDLLKKKELNLLNQKIFSIPWMGDCLKSPQSIQIVSILETLGNSSRLFETELPKILSNP